MTKWIEISDRTDEPVENIKHIFRGVVAGVALFLALEGAKAGTHLYAEEPLGDHTITNRVVVLPPIDAFSWYEVNGDGDKSVCYGFDGHEVVSGILMSNKTAGWVCLKNNPDHESQFPPKVNLGFGRS